jgi:hypothetical protein
MSAKLLGVICRILIRSLSIDIDTDIIVCMANINTPATLGPCRAPFGLWGWAESDRYALRKIVI